MWEGIDSTGLRKILTMRASGNSALRHSIEPESWVADNPDYWQEENDIWYVVLLRDGAFRNAWEIIKVQEDPSGLEHKKYFKSRIEAENFILYNKPCLSINDIGNNIPELTLDRLIQNVKSKL